MRRAAIVSPIRDDGSIVGYLVAANGSARPIDPRERELLVAVASGRSNAEIAQTLVTLGVDLSKVNAVGDLNRRVISWSLRRRQICVRLRCDRTCYSGTVSPEPPNSLGKSLNFGSPSRMAITFSP